MAAGMTMRGFDVFEPMGFDAFGIHSENFAIKQGMHPRSLTARNVPHFREEQLKRIGNRFDWAHEVQTPPTRATIAGHSGSSCSSSRRGWPSAKAAVNWCPKDKTVLADEQVIDGHCERCDSLVERRELEQWFLKITDYADKLLDNLETLDWSERVKTAQRNWIGRSEGLEFAMAVAGATVANHRGIYDTSRHDLWRHLRGVVAAASAGRRDHRRGASDAVTAYTLANSRVPSDACLRRRAPIPASSLGATLFTR